VRATSRWRRTVLDWLKRHPGWLLIFGNLRTEEAAKEIIKLGGMLPIGRILIINSSVLENAREPPP
jgi:hypothetical protein